MTVEELKLEVHGFVQKKLNEYIPVEEITHACNIICSKIQSDGSYDEDTLWEMRDYLCDFDKEFHYLQTVQLKPIIHNQVMLTFADLKKMLDEAVIV